MSYKDIKEIPDEIWGQLSYRERLYISQMANNGIKKSYLERRIERNARVRKKIDFLLWEDNVWRSKMDRNDSLYGLGNLVGSLYSGLMDNLPGMCNGILKMKDLLGYELGWMGKRIRRRIEYFIDDHFF